VQRCGGFASGPGARLDDAGLDTELRLMEALWVRLGRPPRLEPPAVLRKLVAAGHLGRATGRGLYDYLQGVQSYLAPPIFVVFFFGVFWKRLNAKGCLAALGTGFAMGLFRLAVDTPVKLGSGFAYAEGSFLWIVNHIFFQYYSLLIFIVSALVMVAVSLLTEKPAYERISGLTYGTVTAEHRKESRASWTAADVIASAIVLALILGAYLYFTG